MSKSKNYTFIMGFIMSITTFTPYAVAGLKTSEGSSVGVKCKFSKYNKEVFAQHVASIPLQEAVAGRAHSANDSITSIPTIK